MEVIVHDKEWDGVNVPTGFIDFLGQTVRVGDFVVYATSNNSSANLVLGKLLEFKVKDSNDDFYTSSKGHRDPETGKYVSEPYYYWLPKVQPFKDSYSWRDNKLRTVILNNGNRNIIKVDASKATFEDFV